MDVAETHLRKSVETAPPSGFDLVISDSLQCLALVVSERGNHDAALTLVDDAIERARRATSTLAEGRSRIVQGYVLLASGRAQAAAEPLRAGLAEMQRLGQDYIAVEAEAALARAVVAQGDVDEARRFAGHVLDNLGRPDLLGALQPSEIYRSCWQVLVDCADPRADAALAAARAYLDDMDHPGRRRRTPRSFLHRVPANVDLAG